MEDSGMDSTRSTFREKMIQHLFLGELLREFWIHRKPVLRVSLPEVDMGYDLLLEAGKITRHVQLKSTWRGGKTACQNIQSSLQEASSGCAVWIEVDADRDPGRWELAYRFLGGSPGRPLVLNPNSRIAKHTRANARGEKGFRPGLRRVPKSEFKPKKNIAELREALFGPIGSLF
ncbi:MAG: hypothetical protein HY403_05980 [Elusimicrobia bacterium]|nr:hypothetical protein [Elusimicrobiota bacterium]